MFTSWSEFYSYINHLDPKPAPGYQLPEGHTLASTGKYPPVAECFVAGEKIVFEFDEETGAFIRTHNGTNARAVYEQLQKKARKTPRAEPQPQERKTRNHTIMIRTDADTKTALQSEANAIGITMAALINTLLHQHLTRSRNQ